MKGRNFRIYYPLLPFAWIYRAIVSVRNLMFDKGILKSRRFDIPVISIVISAWVARVKRLTLNI